MSENRRGDVSRLDLQSEVGSRLREQRAARRASLRDIATAAGISAGHLSDLEKGNSHASLPVLLRLCRALHLPIADLLPRLGGRRIRESVITSPTAGVERLSHPELELRVDRVVLAAGDDRDEGIDADDDAFAFVVAGTATVTVDGTDYDLAERDALDIERATALRLHSTTGATLLITRAGRR